LHAHIQTYLKEEVIQEGLTRNAGDFARFLETASFSQGESLNISSVARECGIGRKTAEAYFEIVEDLLIARRIPVFQKRAKRRITRHPKFYYFDVGIYRAVRPRGPLDAPDEIDGAALETLVLQEILAWIDHKRLSLKVHYWRTVDQKEVDFVLYGEEGLIAVEVKRSARVTAETLKGLKAFREDYPMARCILLNCGSETHYPDGITVKPVEEVLRQPHLLLG
jgi:predicted AAA+ superfamily ATPase